MIKKYQGIAMIQILIITATLSVFALYITQTARQHVRLASWAQDKAYAELLLHSAESEILFHLLTEKKLPDRSLDLPSSITYQWNFHDEIFELNSQVDIKIQDQAGLINIHNIHQGRFKALLLNNGVNEQRTAQILDRLLDWQDADNITRLNGGESIPGIIVNRNGPIPDITELNHILQLTDREQTLLFSNTGIFFFGDFNPMTASIPLIAALSDENAAQQVNVLRKSKQLTRSNFKEITRIIEGDDMRFYPSNVMKITYVSKVNTAFVTRQVVISLSPYAKSTPGPINLLFDKK